MKAVVRGVSVLVLALVTLTPASQGVLGAEPPVSDGKKVTLQYTLSVPEKGVTSDPAVLSYVHGHQEILGGLERALTGMKEGEHKKIELSADQAYGTYDPAKRKTISTEQLPQGIGPGAMLKSREQESFATVLEIDKETALLDLNHPLAGHDLIYDVKIISVEPAGEEGKH